MTSEVAVMNKEAVALAADSAITFTHGTGQKIFTSANKIFTLSKYQPVGVMMYGNANFMGIPWETIIKIYRSREGQDPFKRLSGYAEDFLAFLRTSDLLSSDFDKEEEEYVNRSIHWCFRQIKEKIDQGNLKLITPSILESENVTALIHQGLVKLTPQIVQKEYNYWDKAETVPSAPTSFAGEFRKMYGEAVDRAKGAVLGELPLTDESSAQLTEIAVNLFLKFPSGVYIPESSGVVFAGFGTDDVFPVLESYTVEGRIGDFVKHKRNEEQYEKIDASTSAQIIPFAQREMVDTFIEGIDPDYELLIREFCDDFASSFQESLADQIVLPNQILNMLYDPEEPDYGLIEDIEYQLESMWSDVKQELEQIVRSKLDHFSQSLSGHKETEHIYPILSVVQGLPKDELAAMAESLINLTSFKRRVSMQAETVAGPIDVAVISKGDGFIWIKRKQYFEDELNPRFAADNYR